jgi:phosphopentomutase
MKLSWNQTINKIILPHKFVESDSQQLGSTDQDKTLNVNPTKSASLTGIIEHQNTDIITVHKKRDIIKCNTRPEGCRLW